MSGAELRCHHLAAGLARHMDVVHLGFTRSGEQPCEAGGVRFFPVPRPHAYRPVDMLRGAIGPVPFPVRNYSRANMTAELERLLDAQHFDIVQVESIHLAGYLPVLRRPSARRRWIVCDWHNIESQLLAQHSRTAGGLRTTYIRRQASLLERYERWFVDQCDAHLVVSEPDRDTLLRYGTRKPVLVVENGVSVQDFAEDCPAVGSNPRRRVLFVGSMDYYANCDAVKYFAAEVWPEIHAHLPDLAFTIVGRNPPPEVRALAASLGIEVTGSVPDVRPYYREALMAVVPLRVGGGTRLKILEAMAAGLPVISTTLGAEGLSAVPGTHYLQADTALAMRARILEAAQGGGTIARIASAGRELVKRSYDWQALSGSLAAQLLEWMAVGERPAAAASA